LRKTPAAVPSLASDEIGAAVIIRISAAEASLRTFDDRYYA
jgi:hypothetical protein